MDHQTGKYLIALGIVILLAGVIIYFFNGYLKWFGKLPGDIKIEKGNFRIYFPLATMLIVSIALTIIISIVKKVF